MDEFFFVLGCCVYLYFPSNLSPSIGVFVLEWLRVGNIHSVWLKNTISNPAGIPNWSSLFLGWTWRPPSSLWGVEWASGLHKLWGNSQRFPQHSVLLGNILSNRRMGYGGRGVDGMNTHDYWCVLGFERKENSRCQAGGEAGGAGGLGGQLTAMGEEGRVRLWGAVFPTSAGAEDAGLWS